MNRFNSFIIKHKKAVIFAFIALTIAWAICIPKVSINYNLSEYLPQDSHTTQALKKMSEEFGNMGSAEAIIKAKDIEEALNIKTELSTIDGISAVAFVDNFDMLFNMGVLNKDDVINEFMKNGYARFIIAFDKNDYAPETKNALSQIQSKYPNMILKGSAINVNFTRLGSFEDVKHITIVALPLFFLILLLMLDSYMEAILLLISMFSALIINMGSNIIFNKISFYALVCMLILQFAISMDYSIFLLHRFNDEKNSGHDKIEAMKIALSASLPTLLASCLTTVAGMLALVIMRYTIGFDLGIVLAKGILISLFSSLVLLPALILTFHKAVEKTSHKRFNLKLPRVQNFILQSRYIIVPAFILITIVAFVFQSKNNFSYGSSALAASPGTKIYKDNKVIEGIFGVNEPMAILVKSGDADTEAKLVRELKKIDGVKTVQSLYAYVNPNLPKALLPQQYLNYFVGKNYSRIILYVNEGGESDKAFEIVNNIKSTVGKYYDDYYVVGDVHASMDIKNTVKTDYIYVNLLSIISVFIIIAITFKKLNVPLLLILIIESSIWLNMSIPYFANSKMIFLGYVIVSSLQLGATIDYAILFTKNYDEFKLKLNKKDALLATMNASTQSIITSGGILASCGIAGGLISRISAINELAMLVGRGAIFSMIAVLVVLPCAIYLIDKSK